MVDLIKCNCCKEEKEHHRLGQCKECYFELKDKYEIYFPEFVK
jgi:hypothetical protein